MAKLKARQAVAFLVSFLMVIATAENFLLAQDFGTYLARAEFVELGESESILFYPTVGDANGSDEISETLHNNGVDEMHETPSDNGKTAQSADDEIINILA